MNENGVFSNFVILDHRPGQQRVFGGQYEHCLRREDVDWLSSKKTVLFVSCDGPLRNPGVTL